MAQHHQHWKNRLANVYYQSINPYSIAIHTYAMLVVDGSAPPALKETMGQCNILYTWYLLNCCVWGFILDGSAPPIKLEASGQCKLLFDLRLSHKFVCLSLLFIVIYGVFWIVDGSAPAALKEALGQCTHSLIHLPFHFEYTFFYFIDGSAPPALNGCKMFILHIYIRILRVLKFERMKRMNYRWWTQH